MRKFFQAVVLLVIITVAGAAVYVFLSGKYVIILNNGTIKTVDDKKVIYLSDGTILYRNEVIDKDDIQSYEKRNIKHLFLVVRHKAISKWYQLKSGTNTFFQKNQTHTNLSSTIPLMLTGLLFFFLIWLRSKGAVEKSPQITIDPDNRTAVSETKEGLPTRLDVVRFFLNLFKYQIGADPDAKIEFVRLMSKSSEPNHIYELRVKHLEDWAKRLDAFVYTTDPHFDLVRDLKRLSP